MRINHNLPALNAYNQLHRNNSSLSQTLEKLASGLQINRAADDAAGLAISEKMRSQIRGLSQAERNILDGVSLTQVADGGLQGIHDMLQRTRELVVQAGNETLTDTDRQAIQKEIDQIKDGIDDIAHNTEFNGIHPLLPKTTFGDNGSSGGKTKLDIVFLIDYSGSMTSRTGFNWNDPYGKTRLDYVKEGIHGFHQKISKKADVHFGVVNITATNRYSPLEGNLENNDMNDLINNARGATSGTKPYDSIIDAYPNRSIGSHMNYREEAGKIFIFFSDARNESGSSTEPAAKNILEGTNIQPGFDSDDIPLYVFGMNGGSISSDDFDDIVESAGGNLYMNITSGNDIVTKLEEDLVNDITENNNLDNTDKPIEPKSIKLQTGPNPNNIFEMILTDARTTSLEIDNLTVDPYEKVDEALDALDKAILTVSSERAKWGAYQNALEHIHRNISNTNINITAAESRIRDADMALQMAEYTKRNILNQSAQAMLAQSNQLPHGILELLK